MFTGLVESTAQLQQRQPQGNNLLLCFASPIAPELKIGQSIAHNGVCLSVINTTPNTHSVVAVQQTLEQTTLRNLSIGDSVNIERALLWQDRIEGHLVQGHVDTTLLCTALIPQTGSHVLTFALPEQYAANVIEKGSICLDGVSLTAFNLQNNSLSVSIIPHTWENTTLRYVNVGSQVHVEFDMVGKFISAHLQRP